MFVLSKIEYKNFNERDVEVPAVIDFVKTKIAEGASSLLDVGGHYSYATYAKDLRAIMTDNSYDACDILPDPDTAQIVNKFWVGNVRDLGLSNYDLVISVSVIEHCGITTYKADDIENEQLCVVKSIMALANKSVFLTFPYGEVGIFPGQFSNIHEKLLRRVEGAWFELKGVGAQIECRFFYNEFPWQPSPKPWVELNPQEASLAPLGKCFCLFTASIGL